MNVAASKKNDAHIAVLDRGEFELQLRVLISLTKLESLTSVPAGDEVA